MKLYLTILSLITSADIIEKANNGLTPNILGKHRYLYMPMISKYFYGHCRIGYQSGQVGHSGPFICGKVYNLKNWDGVSCLLV